MKQKHSKYTVWDNIWYVTAGICQWQPLVLPLTMLHGLAQGLSAFVWLYAVKWIIEIYESPAAAEDKVRQVLMLVGILSVTEFIMLVISNLSDKGGEGRMHDVEYRFAAFWVTKVWTMPYRMQEDPEVQKDIFKARRAINSNGNGVAGLQYWGNQLLPHVIQAVVALGILVMLNPVIVALIVALSYIRFALMDRAAAYEKEQCEDNAAKEQLASWKYQEETADFSYGKDIRLFRMQRPLYRLLRRQSGILNKQAVLSQDRYARNYCIGDGLAAVQEGAAYALLFYKVFTGGLTVADFTLFLGSVHNASAALDEIFAKLIRITGESRHVTDFREFLESGREGGEGKARGKGSFRQDCQAFAQAYIEDGGGFQWDPDAGYEFVFDHVSFQYPGASSYALRDLCLCLGAGEKLAVVGLNGAGKSTFVKLLCRLYEPTEGHIYLNGRDIAEYSLDEYWRLVAPVFQEDESLAFSIAQNVSMRRKEEQDSGRIMEALREAGLEEKMRELPAGIDTSLYKNLDDAGVDLSGGQKQKLMIARALYKGTPVIVLDEPTAALDAIAESRSYEDFNRMAGGRTTVYISHRLSSTKFCDRIAMFEGGRLAEYGTHDELMMKKGKYAGLFEVQAQYYTEEGGAAYA